jgi:hypothetical protein
MAAIARMRSFVLDCPDTRVLSEFYRDLLGWEIIYAAPDDEDGWTVVSDGTHRIGFQRVADYRPPRWPDPEYPQQAHLDFAVDDLDTAERQAIDLGATKADFQANPDRDRTMIDPAGHPFCLCIVPD